MSNSGKFWSIYAKVSTTGKKYALLAAKRKATIDTLQIWRRLNSGKNARTDVPRKCLACETTGKHFCKLAVCYSFIWKRCWQIGINVSRPII